ncbi:MAG: hypothetical protein ISS02_01960 [Candidatus Portnoybacteria bacterium]|nr:hypothetical protein [Candidatus Portnoybacteria bacterium]
MKDVLIILIIIVIILIVGFFAYSPNVFQGKIGDGGLYKSIDMGEQWEQLAVNDKKISITSLDVLSMAVDPNDSEVVYMGTRDSGIYKSFSQGEYWHQLEDGNSVLSTRANVYDIAIDHKDSNLIYIGTYQDKKGRVFRTQDGGDSWEEVYVVSKEKYAVFAIAIDNYDSSVVYIGTAQGGFLRSTDYGKSWEIIKWFDDVVSDIAINPQDTRIIYISAFKDGVYKTTNKGVDWQSFKEELEEFQQGEKVERVVVDPKRPNIIYTGSEYGILTSKNSGQTWQEVKIVMPPESKPVLSLVIEPQNTDHLYYGAGSIIYRSLDQGVNWTVHELSSKRNVKSITIDPNNANIIYIGMHKDE